MKRRIIFLVLIAHSTLSWTQQENDKIYVETTQLDTLYLIENGIKQPIPPKRSDNTFFEFDKSGYDQKLQPICGKCRKGVTIKLISKKDNLYTTWIPLRSKETIKVSEALSHIEEDNIIESFGSWFNAIVAFIKTGGTGRVSPSGTRLMGDNQPEPGDPKLDFRESNDAPYINANDLQIQFSLFKNYPILTLYLTDEEGRIVMWSGDTKYGEGFVDFENQSIPSIKQIIRLQSEDDYKKTYLVDWESISKFLWEPLNSNSKYQIGILLEKDEYLHNPYLLDFNLISYDSYGLQSPATNDDKQNKN